MGHTQNTARKSCYLAGQLLLKPWRNKKPRTHVLRLLLTPDKIYKRRNFISVQQVMYIQHTTHTKRHNMYVCVHTYTYHTGYLYMYIYIHVYRHIPTNTHIYPHTYLSNMAQCLFFWEMHSHISITITTSPQWYRTILSIPNIPSFCHLYSTLPPTFSLQQSLIFSLSTKFCLFQIKQISGITQPAFWVWLPWISKIHRWFCQMQ